MKNTQLNLRLSDNHKELLERVAKQCGMTVSAFILSVVIPYCCKIDNSNK